MVTDIPAITSTDGTSTPAGEPADDFFSSWDKPTIKRPSNPPSRTGTPPVVSRTASPFLSANANGNSAARPKSPSPLAAAADAENNLPAPAAIRTTTSSAIRKGPTSTGPKRVNILGAKKAQKLGAKKVVGEEIDFEAAEKKAKEEAERIEKLGYDPEAEKVDEVAKVKPPVATEKPAIAAPTPISPPKLGYGAQTGHQRSPSEMERLGMGMGRLGFGQVGGAKPAGVPNKLGFGSVGTPKATEGSCLLWRDSHFHDQWLTRADHFYADDSEQYARQKFGGQKGISSDEFFGRASFDPTAQAEAKTRLQGFEGATSISSNAYFGRPEADEAELRGDYGDLETAAKDFVRKFGLTAGDDLENLIQVAGEGGRKLQGAIRNYLNS